MKLNEDSYIDIDVAIEIINKMVADCYAYINPIDIELESLGLSYVEDRLEVDYNRDFIYEKKLREVAQYRSEIAQIYNSEDIKGILEKVETEYAPYLKKKNSEQVRLFTKENA